MRDLNKETWLWYFFTSREFYEQAAQACDALAEYFANLAVSKGMGNYGRNNQIYNSYRRHARDFRRGIELLQHAEYSVVYDAATGISNTGRGIAVNLWPFDWMTNDEQAEYDRLSARAWGFSDLAVHALENGLRGGTYYLEKDSYEPEIVNRNTHFPGDSIIRKFDFYNQDFNYGWSISNPLPRYAIDYSHPCKTTETVPWTGVWYPETGLERHSLTFAIKGKPMQPTFRIEKTEEEVEALEEQGVEFKYLPGGYPLCTAVETTWYPVIPVPAPSQSVQERGRVEAHQPCPKTGYWWTPAKQGSRRHFNQGELMPNFPGSQYGATIWYWDQNQE